MKNFINMKIAVTADQPLDEIVMELKSKGCVKCSLSGFIDIYGSFIIVTKKGVITWSSSSLVDAL